MAARISIVVYIATLACCMARTLALPPASQKPLVSSNTANIVLTNDDGWAEINIRTLYDSLTSAGNSVLLSAPAENESGTGSSEAPPTTVGDSGCEFDSCPAGSPPVGFNSSQPRWNYVNSYPVSSMKYGVQTLAPKSQFFGKAPDIVVSGFNVGSNTGVTTFLSGTVGAASAAADQLAIPGIAFSGSTGTQIGWTVPTPDYALIYADLATNLTDTLLASGGPYLPSGTYLNVNFATAGSGTSCTSAQNFSFILTRIFDAVPIVSGKDVNVCNNGGRLPTEAGVISEGCYASVSLGHAHTKLDATAVQQAVVLQKLNSILSCLPSS